jgi:hypothetical protein
VGGNTHTYSFMTQTVIYDYIGFFSEVWSRVWNFDLNDTVGIKFHQIVTCIVILSPFVGKTFQC